MSQPVATSTNVGGVEQRLLRRFELLFARTTEAMFITDGYGAMLDVNGPMLELMRMGRAEFLASDIATLLSDGESQQLQIRAERIAQGTATGEADVVIPGRGLTRVRFWTIEVETGDGGLRAFAGVTPISVSPSAKQTHTILRAIFDDSPDGELVVDGRGNTLYVNCRYLDHWGLSEADLRRPFKDRWAITQTRLTDPSALLDFFTLVRHQPGSPHMVVLEMSNHTVLEVRSSTLSLDGVTPFGFSYTTRDVTEQANADKKARAAASLLASVSTHSPEGIVVVDPEGNVIHCNARFLDMWDVGEPWTRLSADERLRELAPRVLGGEDLLAVSQALLPDHAALFEGELAMADGRTLGLHAKQLRDSRGQVLGRASFYRDLSEERAAAKAIIASRTAEAFQSLAAGVAHKINNSLASIVGNAYLAGLPEGFPEESAESLREIVNSASDATSLVRDLLALSGHGHHALMQVNVSSEVETVLDQLPPGERRRVTIDLAPGLPQLLADTGTLAQAVANVLTNALEAGSTVRASTAMKTDFIAEAGATYAPGRPPQGRYVVIEIADDGPGIAAEVAGRLFEPFASTRAAGRGLGLPATAGIMGAHHGFVEIRASPAGCTVRLLLPAT